MTMKNAMPVETGSPSASFGGGREIRIIAVPTRSNRTVDDHFGHCAQFTLFSAGADNAVQEAETVLSPPGCGCKSNIAVVLKQKGVSILLAGSMGDGALNVLQRQGIQVHRGCSGDAAKAVGAFLAGAWKDSGIGCAQHHEHGDHAPHDGSGHQH
jgi:predicted Fe-Mo cluster-binding NifX family protein